MLSQIYQWLVIQIQAHDCSPLASSLYIYKQVDRQICERMCGLVVEGVSKKVNDERQ